MFLRINVCSHTPALAVTVINNIDCHLYFNKDISNKKHVYNRQPLRVMTISLRVSIVGFCRLNYLDGF